MAEITALSTLAKASVASTDYVVVANSSTKIAKRFQLQSLYPTVASPGTGSEDLYISATLTNQNQIQFKGLKSGDTGLLTVATASNNLVLTVLEAGIDLSLCNNATSVFLTGVDFTGSVTGTNAVVHGGTGLSTVAKGSLLYASATDTIAASAAMSTNGQLLIGNGSTGVPTVATLTAGANITITPAAGSITIAATLTTLAAALDTGSYNIDLNTNYISDNGSDRGLYVHTNGLVVCNNSGSTLTSGNITGQLNLQGTATTAVTIGNSGAYQSSYNILTTTSGSGTAGAALNIKAATAGGGNMAGGALSLYAGTATGSGAGGVVSLIAGEDVTINEGSLIITGAQEGIVHTNSGTGTQATNHTTGITLNSTSGVITLAAVALAATTNAEFTVTNNTVQADSVILLTIQDENTTNNAQLAVATHTIAGGSFKISIVNPHSSGATSATASKIHFLVINNSV